VAFKFPERGANKNFLQVFRLPDRPNRRAFPSFTGTAKNIAYCVAPHSKMLIYLNVNSAFLASATPCLRRF